MGQEREKGADDRTCATCGGTLPPIQSFICQFAYRDKTDVFEINAFAEFCSYEHLALFVAENGPGGPR